jgi:hypothetical protein
MYSTSFGPTRTLVGAFVTSPTGFGEADVVSAGAGFPGNGFEMDDRCSCATALAFAPCNAEEPTILAGWNGSYTIRKVKVKTTAITPAGAEQRHTLDQFRFSARCAKPETTVDAVKFRRQLGKPRLLVPCAKSEAEVDVSAKFRHRPSF